MLLKVASWYLRHIVKRSLSVTGTMANSKYEYVRNFESEDKCLPDCWIVIRLDGKNFSKFTTSHKFEKPNDRSALELMNRAAISVMNEIKEIVIAYGQSDEYSFVFKKDVELYGRRVFKLLTNVNSLFSSSYVFYWNEYFKDKKMQYPPSFDGRVVLYPNYKSIRDYLSWRQVDVHINNLYNTCFWNLVLKKNMSTTEAQEFLKGTFSADKNELLFHDFGINYNNEPEMFKKGTTLIQKTILDENNKKKSAVVSLNVDIIRDSFWIENPQILGEFEETKKSKNSKPSNK